MVYSYETQQQQQQQYYEQHQEQINTDDPFDESEYEELFKMITSKIVRCKSPIDLVLFIDREWKHMNHINVATTVTKAARICDSIHVRKFKKQRLICLNMYQKLFKLIEMFMEEMSSRSISNCIWSLGKGAEILQIDERIPEFRSVYRKLCKRILQDQEFLAPQDFTNVIWSFAKIGWTEDDMHTKMIDHVINSFQINDADNPLQISNRLWAMATLNYKVPIDEEKNDVLGRLLELTDFKQDVQYLKEFDHQSIANVLWALRRFRYYDGEFLKAVESVIISGFWNFSLQVKACIIDNDQRIAIEVLQNGMYTSNCPRKLLGTAAAYLNCLKGLGWKVVDISLLYWNDHAYQKEQIERIQQCLQVR
eukprot:TRINITY_DN9073_c0_g1_i1.p1 TRINITY_DN9073_c0_g1~~TRINITY_DN9073_c0_g1_i1.p1  ORF type:complete len:417 (-),score=21.30 TRINITY_DN9073_c0_g1_i1:285-1379(-)